MGRARTEPKHAGAILRTAETAACALVCMCALACSRIHLGCHWLWSSTVLETLDW